MTERRLDRKLRLHSESAYNKGHYTITLGFLP
jgi:hypothetical protein